MNRKTKGNGKAKATHGHAMARKTATPGVVRKRISREAAREVEIPTVVNQERRDSCRLSLLAFIKTYHSHSFYLPFSKDHLRVIDSMQRAILTGGCYVTLCWRGFGKTTITEAAAEWATLYGHVPYVLLIGATQAAAQELIASITTDLEQNDILYEDFPEVCHCIRELQGTPQKAATQTVHGERTLIELRKSVIVYPTLQESQSSGVILKALGLTGRLRGLKHKRADGSVIRPAFIIADDPQTDKSAISVKQCEQREALIVRTALGSAGPGRKVACVIPCTCIASNDLTCMLMDPKRNPEFTHDKCQLVLSWPDSQKTLWAEYAEIRRRSLEEGDAGKAATRFYRKNRKTMDAGARTAWPQNHAEDELSDIQHVENMLLKYGKEGFEAEFQGEPPQVTNRPYTITPEIVATRLNHYQRGEIPKDAAFTIAFADVNKFALVWAVASYGNDFTGAVIDYGRWPEHGDLYQAGKGETEEQSVYRGICGWLDSLAKHTYQRAGAPGIIDYAFIDCGWNQDAVLRAVALYQRQGRRVYASKGFGQRYRVRHPVGKPGTECHLAEWPSGVRVVEFSSGYWIVRVQNAMILPAGSPGGLSLWGDSPETHRKFSREICGQRLLSAHQGEMGILYEWDYAVGERHDYLDAVVGTSVGASLCGLSIHGVAAPQGSGTASASPSPASVQPQQQPRRRTLATYE